METEASALATGLAADGNDGPARGRERRRYVVRGVVQGVGFRPFVWALAERHALDGFVRNTSGGVVVEAEGATDDLDALAIALRDEAPRLARISAVEVTAVAAVGEPGFRIEESRAVA